MSCLDERTFFNHVKALLEARFSNTAVYIGQVPDTVPADPQGRVYPYIVIWPSPGADLPDQRDLTGAATSDHLTVSFRTTLVAASALVLLDMITAVRPALTDAYVGAGRIQPDDLYRNPDPVPDTTVKPVRHYVPLYWTITTR